eukprot:2772539-Rhodomonas_salina.2
MADASRDDNAGAVVVRNSALSSGCAAGGPCDCDLCGISIHSVLFPGPDHPDWRNDGQRSIFVATVRASRHHDYA